MKYFTPIKCYSLFLLVISTCVIPLGSHAEIPIPNISFSSDAQCKMKDMGMFSDWDAINIHCKLQKGDVVHVGVANLHAANNLIWKGCDYSQQILVFDLNHQAREPTDRDPTGAPTVLICTYRGHVGNSHRPSDYFR